MTTLDVDRILLNVNQACQALEVSRSTLYELIAKGELKVVKLGGRQKSGVRLRPQDLQEFANRRAAQAKK